MSYGRQATFWLLTFLVLAGLLWLLRDVLLPFVAGLALAYLQAPLADRLERLGMSRTIAALLIVVVVMLALITILLLVVPLLIQQLAQLVSSLPDHVTRVREILTEWLNWLQAGESTMTLSELFKQASAWLTAFAYSLWSGTGLLRLHPHHHAGRHLLLDPRLASDVGSWIVGCRSAIARRCAVARDIDRAISGFVRGH
jgi:predicted PurR-regulated permease PerM